MALAKTTPPLVHRIVPRPRLFRQLDRGRSCPLTWVSGPPGSGKTSLVASYIQARRLFCLWYQVDSGDTDLARFFQYLSEAAPRSEEGLPRLTSSLPEAAPVFARQFFRQLFNELKTPFVLVLDEFQEAQESEPFCQVIREAASQVPPDGRIMILSRTGPPPALARLAVNRRIHLVGWTDLRLTAQEIGLLARDACGTRLARNAAQALQERTDGWAAGLVVLLQPSNAQPEEAHLSTVLTDYVVAEILQQFGDPARSALLQIAFLPRATASLAERLTGFPAAPYILAVLHARNYFTVAHGTENPVYEFHPLLRDALLSYARRMFSPARIAQIQRAAAGLLEESGQIRDALALLRDAKDWSGLADLIRECAEPLMADGRGQTLLEWIAYLPEGMRAKDPWLLYWQAAALVSVEPAHARLGFERALDGFRASEEAEGAYSAWSGAVESYLHERHNLESLDALIVVFGQLQLEFPEFPSPEREARVIVSLLPALYLRQPGRRELAAWITRAEQLFRTHLNPDLRLQLGCHLVCAACLLGRFSEARGTVARLATLVDRATGSPLLRVWAKNAIALYQWLTAAADDALATIAAARALAAAAALPLQPLLLCNAAAAHLSRGDSAAAGEILKALARDLRGATPFDLVLHDLLGAWCLLLDLPDAPAPARAFQAVEKIGVPLVEALVGLAGLWFDLFRKPCPAPAVRSQLAAVYRLARQLRCPPVAFSAGLAAAYFHLFEKHPAHTRRSLSQAMRVGREHGYRSALLWLDRVMAVLCTQAVAEGIESEYVLALVRARSLRPDPPALEFEQWPWPIKVYTLGSFAVWRDGQPIRFLGKAQKRPLALLKGLIALGGENVSEERLSDLLWPEADGDAAQQALSTTLHRLRHLLTHDVIHRQAGRLSLDRRHCWVDAWALDHMVERAEDLVAVPNPREQVWMQSAQWTERAVRLHGGDFLADDPDSPWAASFAERVRDRLLLQVQKIARHWAQAGDWDRAVACYKRAADIHACSEECCRGLMVAYQHLGRRDEALAVYQRCTRTLNTRWGIAPSPQTVALLNSLKSGQTAK